MSEKAGVEITVQQGVAVVAFKATSISNTEQVATTAEPIYEFVEENHPNKIVIDFEGVRFFSSEVLGMLLAVRTKLQLYDGKVVISAINPQLHRVFKITNLDKIFKFFPDKKSAVKAVNIN